MGFFSTFGHHKKMKNFLLRKYFSNVLAGIDAEACIPNKKKKGFRKISQNSIFRTFRLLDIDFFPKSRFCPVHIDARPQ
jgi:hypothetical protein